MPAIRQHVKSSTAAPSQNIANNLLTSRCEPRCAMHDDACLLADVLIQGTSDFARGAGLAGIVGVADVVGTGTWTTQLAA